MTGWNWRPLLVAAGVGVGSMAFFGLIYLGANLLLETPDAKGLRNLCLWDCGWYGSIADRGYVIPKGDLRANYGFFPGFPIAAWVVMKLTGLGYLFAGLLLNTLLAVLFALLVLTHRAELLLRDEADALLFLVAFLVSPWSLYNHVPYTEMLFNLEVLGTFLMWRRGNYPAAAAFGIMLTATRVSGVILPLVLLAELVFRERRHLLELLLRPDGRFRALAAMPLGLMGFLTYLYFHLGDPLAYFRIQAAGWSQGVRDPLGVFIGALVMGGAPRDGALAFIAASVLLLMGYLLRRIPGPLAAFAWIAPSLSVASTLSGQPRYALASFVIHLIAPALPRPLQWPVVALLAMGQAVFMYVWLRK